MEVDVPLTYTYMFLKDNDVNERLLKVKDHEMLKNKNHIMDTSSTTISTQNRSQQRVDDIRFSQILQAIAIHHETNPMFNRVIKNEEKKFKDVVQAIQNANYSCKMLLYDDKSETDALTTIIGSPSIFIRRGNDVVGIVQVGTKNIESTLSEQGEVATLQLKYPKLGTIEYPYIERICALKGMGKSVLTITEYMILKMYYNLLPNLYIALSPLYDEAKNVASFYENNGYDINTLDDTAIKEITVDVQNEINLFGNKITCETPEEFYNAIKPLEGGARIWRKTRKYIRMHNGSRKQVYVNAITQKAIKVGHKYVIFNIKQYN